MTSGGNRNPANPETGGWMGRMRRRRFVPTAWFSHSPGTNPTASMHGRGQCNRADKDPDTHMQQDGGTSLHSARSAGSAAGSSDRTESPMTSLGRLNHTARLAARSANADTMSET